MTITTGRDLFDAAAAAFERFGPHRPWFRGHASDAWTLRPKVFRSTIRTFEADLLLEFRLRAPTRYPSCPPGRELCDWLTLMQHYGLPTRLLDWTESILVAAFFATNPRNDVHEDAVIWALDPARLNQIMTNDEQAHPFLPHHEKIQPLVGAAFGLNRDHHKSRILSLRVPEIDLRMLVQQGAFTIHEAAETLDVSPGHDEFLMRFVIPEDAKVNVRTHLEAAGIRWADLFPDLGHLADEIRISREALAQTTCNEHSKGADQGQL